MQHEIGSVSFNNELQETIVKDQAIEIEHLKEEVSKHITDKQNYEKMEHELFELAKGLKNMVHKLGGNEMAETQRTADVIGQLPLLEKLVTAIIWDSENSRSKAQELDTKILRTQEVVDELSSKVKFFEESNKGRGALTNSIQEREDHEAHALSTRSEISEIEDGVIINTCLYTISTTSPMIKHFLFLKMQLLWLTFSSGVLLVPNFINTFGYVLMAVWLKT